MSDQFKCFSETFSTIQEEMKIEGLKLVPTDLLTFKPPMSAVHKKWMELRKICMTFFHLILEYPNVDNSPAKKIGNCWLQTAFIDDDGPHMSTSR